jgi:hypothetical protein
MSRTVSTKNTKTISCAYCKETGHYMRATHDINSAITCPALKEKERRKREDLRTPQQTAEKKPPARPVRKEGPILPVNRFLAFSNAEDSDEEEKSPKQLSRTIEFPSLPTITVTVSQVETTVPQKRSYASVAIPLEPAEQPVCAVVPKTPERGPKEFLPSHTYAPRKPPAVFPNTASIRSYRGRWADNYSSDEEEE